MLSCQNRRRISTFLIACILATSAIAYPTYKTPHQIEHEKLGTNSDPIVVRIMPPDKTTEDLAQEKIEREHKETADQRLVTFTGYLVLVGILQLAVFVCHLAAFIYQGGKLKQTVDEMKASANTAEKAANAADLNARAAIGVRLPILRSTPVDIIALDAPLQPNTSYGGAVNDGIPTRYSGIGYIPIKNHGKTAAFPTMFKAGWKVTSVLPDTPIYLQSMVFNHATVIEPDEMETVDFHASIEITDEERAAIIKQTAWLWFYGSVTYLDFMDVVREYRFCWRFANRNPLDHPPVYFFASDGEPPKAYIKADI